MNSNNKKKEEGANIRTIMSIVATVLGAACFLFLLTYGISYSNTSATYAFNASELSMGHLIFGGDFGRGINPGLFSAFLIMALAVILALAMNWNDMTGYFSIILFITSSILWFCTVPLYGNTAATLSTAGWCLGVFNLVDAALVFIGVAYK